MTVIPGGGGARVVVPVRAGSRGTRMFNLPRGPGGWTETMTAFALDSDGQARLALLDIFRVYGRDGIDDGTLIDRHLPDLLPDAPREASLLRAAAVAKVGQLLIDRIGAHIPADAAVRDVAAILAGRLAFDLTACLWVVSEYARVLGHPVDITPPTPAPESANPPAKPAKTPAPKAPAPKTPAPKKPAPSVPDDATPEEPTSDGEKAESEAPIPRQKPPFVNSSDDAPEAGRNAEPKPDREHKHTRPPLSGLAAEAGSVFVDPRVSAMPGGLPMPRDPWETTPLPASLGATFPAPGRAGTLPERSNAVMRRRGGRRNRSRTAIITIGVAVAAVLVAAGIVLALQRGPTCGSSSARPCGGPTTTPSVLGGGVAPASGASPSASAGGSPSAAAPPASLAQLMPLDVNVNVDNCITNGSFLSATAAYYYCDESSTPNFALTGTTRIWGYQFRNAQDLDAAIVQLNRNVKFDPARSGYSCPPQGNNGGTARWYRADKSKTLGTLECYTVTRNGATMHDYVWTSAHDFTIMLCETTDSFPHLETWWERNNDNDNGQV